MKTAFVTGGRRGIGRQIVADLKKEGYKVAFNSASRPYFVIEEPLDVLVLNAGITDRSAFDMITREEWNRVINVNLTEPFFLVQKTKMNDNGRIIFISSILAEIPHSISISYPVTKAAINALVKNLVKHFAERKITVNAVAPGFIDTDWHKNKSEEVMKKITDRIALGWFGNVENVSSLVMEIINNDYINGQILTVDGGYDYC